MQITDVLRSLEKHLSHPVIYADQVASKPTYPYIAIKEIVSFIPAANHPSVTNENMLIDIKRTATSQPEKSLSITSYGVNLSDAAELIQQAHDWFSFVGKQELKNMGFVVSTIESIMNRDSLIVDDYERRRGFDVILRFTHSLKKKVTSIESVDLTVNRIKE